MSEKRDVKCVLIHDNFQNFKSYNIPKAQLVIADIPYNIGADFYASRPDWYVDGDNRNGESDKARKAAFNTDFTFNIAEYFHFCNRLLKKEPGTGEKDAPCMIVFCSFQQIPQVITEAEKYEFRNYIPLVFCKNYSPQVLKANMKVVGATEYSCRWTGKSLRLSWRGTSRTRPASRRYLMSSRNVERSRHRRRSATPSAG